MEMKWMKIGLVLGLIFILAACTGTQAAPTPTSAPPTAVESEEDTESDAAEEQSQDDSSADDEAGTDDQEAEEEASAPAIDAAAIYAQNCARCHGADRVSGSAPDLVPAQLTGDRESYVGIIANGSGPMPAWAGSLSAEEIDALVDFILSTPE